LQKRDVNMKNLYV